MIKTNNSVQTEFSIHPATLIGHVSLTVANLENQIALLSTGVGIQTPLA